eukprot:3110701-Prymnesium_polylepis.1
MHATTRTSGNAPSRRAICSDSSSENIRLEMYTAVAPAKALVTSLAVSLAASPHTNVDRRWTWRGEASTARSALQWRVEDISMPVEAVTP